MRTHLIVASLLAVAVAPATGQVDSALARAQAAYNELDYAGAIQLARQALRGQLLQDERISAYELLGYSYGALDSTRQAVDAFRRLIFLAPDREPDVERISPRITSLYASALGQVLVVRRVRIDSGSFVSGAGSVPIRFEVSRTALARTRVIGPGTELVVDSETVAGTVQVSWTVQGADRRPLPAGEYEIVVTASEGEREEYSSHPVRVRVVHGAVDTLPLLDSLPEYREQPESVTPPRDWRPLALATGLTALVSGAFFAMDNKSLGTGPRTAMISVATASLATGLGLSLRKPEPRPSSTNILYNRLVRELLARRNAEIARQNADRRAETLITVRPEP
jgi:tetratricopeptide (TPR) repeat protein